MHDLPCKFQHDWHVVTRLPRSTWWRHQGDTLKRRLGDIVGFLCLPSKVTTPSPSLSACAIIVSVFRATSASD